MTAELADLYPAHLAHLKALADAALARCGKAELLVPSGVERYAYLDDRSYPYFVNPQFKAWVPLTQHPGSWLRYRPGQTPVLIYHQPRDYWHAPPSPPEGYWVPHFDVRVIRTPDEALDHLPQDPAHCAILGEAEWGIGALQPNNPQQALDYLHFHRAAKTPYELAAMRIASLKAARGHRAAEAAFRGGASEHEIHLAYCAAVGHTDEQLPYSNIVALNENGAVLHYHHTPGPAPAQPRSFLIDAGAQHLGYAADITRTYAAHAGRFADLIAAMDRLQLGLCAEVRAGRPYPDLHLACHARLAQLLLDAGLAHGSPEALQAEGVTRTFFPHGLGHYLGLQVHDVGGFQASESGGTIAKPEGHPYLRLTRTLAPDQVLTVEPGLYFIPMLLDELRRTRGGTLVDWPAVEALLPYGGIRIEDDVRVTTGEPENLSRNAFAALG